MKVSKWTDFLRRFSARLPPGDMINIDASERSNRQLLLDLAMEHGPVFKGLIEGRHTTFIVGIELGRAFLRTHSARLKPYTLDISGIVPFGFIRQMQGETHRRYRSQLTRAFTASQLDELLNEASDLEAQALQRYRADADWSPGGWLACCSDISLRLLCHVFFGISDATAQSLLIRQFKTLGPIGLVWKIGARQEAAYRTIHDHLRECLTHNLVDARALLGSAENQVDDTFLGNLIYMVEMGRYDMSAMYRTLSRYASSHPAHLRQFVPNSGHGAAQAFVEEELRTDQSERLVRHVLEDIRFKGWLMPAGSLVRICMWEAHHDPDVFAEPMRFKPERFLTNRPTAQQFSPFGLDRHQCPFADLSIKAGIRFVEALAAWTVRQHGDLAPVRGAYHWEVAHDFSIELGDTP